MLIMLPYGVTTTQWVKENLYKLASTMHTKQPSEDLSKSLKLILIGIPKILPKIASEPITLAGLERVTLGDPHITQIWPDHH